MSSKPHDHTTGPFRAEQLRCGDPYELDNGHLIECLPSGGRHAKANLSGGVALETDPSVESAGFDPGFTPDENNLRAPDIAVGNVPDAPGWISGAPPLAVEYADIGQNEQNLQKKIRTLLGAGTRYVWVVRLTGPRRVEVYEPHASCSPAYPGQQLKAPAASSPTRCRWRPCTTPRRPTRPRCATCCNGAATRIWTPCGKRAGKGDGKRASWGWFYASLDVRLGKSRKVIANGFAGSVVTTWLRWPRPYWISVRKATWPLGWSAMFKARRRNLPADSRSMSRRACM